MLIVAVMSLSFASVILTPSIMAGVTRSLDEQQINAVSGNAVIQPPSDKYYLEGVNQIDTSISGVAGVTAVSPRLESGAFIEYQWQDKILPTDRGKEGNWPVIGIDPAMDSNVTSISAQIIQGNYLSAGDRDMILLGTDIAGTPGVSGNNLQGAQVGDKIRLTYANGIQKEYTVKGIFQTKEMSADRMAFVTRDEMVSVLGGTSYSDTATQILVKFNPSYSESNLLSDLRSLDIGGTVQSWQEYGGSVGGIVNSFDMIASLISGISLVVVAIVMFIVIYINVVNHKKQIGILRAIGINRRIIIYSYLFQSIFYAFMGMAVGGLLFQFGIKPYFDLHPINLPIGQVSLLVKPYTLYLAVFGILLSAVFAGIIPVFTIIRQTIIKSIWGS